ncbi:MAG: hypothetical protein B7X84_07295 [Alphaproteobacteria bacterium 17-39-52]|nr:MAG: hypothetical protein B7X84_07295 [Alphaproteobacteria bacterium 17-39-52]
MNAFEFKKKQYLYAGLIGAVGLGIMGQRINPQEIWVERMEGENKLTQKKLETLEKLMMSNAQTVGNAEDKVQQLEQDLEELRSSNASGNWNQGEQSVSDDGAVSSFSNSSMQNPMSPESLGNGVQKIVLNLSGTGPHVKKQEKATLENTLPAGAFAKAILLGGVDASTSISAPSDPRPLLLRVTDKGTLPRKFHSDLKDCHVLASCYGDLSSERVYMRLEKLTCTERLTGEISETQVAGYVVGEDGKAGLRGVVADRAGPIVRNSLIGGFFSGMGKFFESQQTQLTLPTTPFGAMNPLSAKQMLSAGAASGTSHALEKYADFFIKRAEQLQPVLQVAAGREVDIVFTQGTRFGETSVRKTLSKIRDKSRQEVVQSLETENSNWLPEMPQGENL